MDIEVLDSADAVAQRGAAIIAADAAAGVRAYGRYRVAFSGGRTPWTMLKALRGLDVPWPDVDVLQVDERIATDGDADRNLTHLQETLGGIAGVRVHAMPVTLPDPASAAATYAATLRDLAGSPPVLDLVHLGLGPDGHTASLIPGDAVLEVTDADVAATGVYQGRRRITLTYPALNRARRILWIVTGRDKTEMLRRLIDGDRSIPAGRVERERAMVVADREAMGGRLAE
jgi:6-phosphogluconolactonase